MFIINSISLLFVHSAPCLYSSYFAGKILLSSVAVFFVFDLSCFILNIPN